MLQGVETDRRGAAVQRYSAGAIVLHWLIALCLAFELALGFAMPRDATGFGLFQLHKSIGIAILLLTFLRLGWRLTHNPPPPVEGGLTGFLAKAVHFAFYAFLILAPLTGWAIVSTAPVQVPTLLFGVVELPHLPLPGGWNETVEEAHEVLAWIGLALFVLHVAGALRHHYLLRDPVLGRMGPGGSARIANGLTVLVIAIGILTLLLASGSAPEQGDDTQVAAVETQGSLELARPETIVGQEELDGTSADAENAPTAEEEADAQDESAEPAVAAEEPAGPPPVWTIQPGGTLRFSVGNGGAAINGSFAEWGGTVRFDPDAPEDADIRIDVNLSSASVGDPTQDRMLEGDEFFAIASGPTATYRTTSVRRTGDGRYTAQGTLSLRGASLPQTVSFRLTGEGLRRHVEGSATIDRVAFGVGTGSSAAGLDRNVSLSFSFDAVGRRP